MTRFKDFQGLFKSKIQHFSRIICLVDMIGVLFYLWVRREIERVPKARVLDKRMVLMGSVLRKFPRKFLLLVVK